MTPEFKAAVRTKVEEKLKTVSDAMLQGARTQCIKENKLLALAQVDAEIARRLTEKK